jgi:voltage-gated potassium channel
MPAPGIRAVLRQQKTEKPKGNINMTATNSQRVTIWQVSMLVLCVYVLLAMLAEMMFKLPEQVVILLGHIDLIVCLVFIADFVMQLTRAEDKLSYLKWGWIDLVSSIPNIQVLRCGRLFRIVRIIRLLRGVRSTRLILQILFAKRSHGTFASVGLASFILVAFSSIAILFFEDAPASNIKTAGNALWWAFTTMTTVGYGDFYPVTLEGRIIAAILMTAGIALFGTFTAYVASWFFETTGAQGSASDNAVLQEIKAVRAQLEKLQNRTT